MSYSSRERLTSIYRQVEWTQFVDVVLVTKCFNREAFISATFFYSKIRPENSSRCFSIVKSVESRTFFENHKVFKLLN